MEDTLASIVGCQRKLAQQSKDLLRLFERRDHYVLVGADAEATAASYFKSTAPLKYVTHGSGDKYAYLTLNKNMAAEVIRSALIDQRVRVEVLRQESSSWVVGRRGSPGNLQAFEEECMVDGALPAEAAAIIAAVKFGKRDSGFKGVARAMGVAFIDCAARAIRTSVFEDDEQLSTLESLICQQGTRECVLPAELGAADQAKLADLFEMCEVPVSTAKPNAFSARDAAQDLRRLLGGEPKELHGRHAETSLAIDACAGLISYLGLMAQPETHGQWALEWVDPAHFMRLDAGAMRALSLEPVPGEASKASLLGIVSQCKTLMGGRLVRRWLRQPLLSPAEIESRLDLVDAFASSIELRCSLRDEVPPRPPAAR